MGERTITRRALLARGAALAGAIAVPSACGGGDSSSDERRTTGNEPLTVYALSVGCDGEERCACKACTSHAANKVFASMEAANANRAHTHCNCVVEPAGRLAHATYVELFGEPGNVKVQAVDRRRPGIADKLRELQA